MSLQLSETIAAIATPPGVGAISVIRISGPQAFEIAGKVFSRGIASFASHTAHYGKILSKEGEILDTVLLLIMKGPRSYTGEDSIEISCHGGSFITQRVLERIFEAGATPAQPGEFSLRAYLNGKIDLAQAEAVQQLIAAKSTLAWQSAGQQLEGVLSKRVGTFQRKLTDLTAILEAWVDFPEEGLEFITMEQLCRELETVCREMETLKETFHDGRLLQEGISLCLLGAPNVGKSSLMNALLGYERAIVTPIAGTTRDLIEETLKLGQLHFRLIDTAGIRETEEVVEQEGIRRTQKAWQEADLILLLLDASRPLQEEDQKLLDSAPQDKTIVVWNKVDLKKPVISFAWASSCVSISAKERTGLDELRIAVEKLIWKNGPPSKEEVVITQERHFQALSHAIDACKTVIQGLQTNVSAEFVSSDLRHALHELGKIIGTNVTEDILSAIFSKFCLGK